MFTFDQCNKRMIHIHKQVKGAGLKLSCLLLSRASEINSGLVVMMAGMARRDESQMIPDSALPPALSWCQSPVRPQSGPARQLQPTLRAICLLYNLPHKCTLKRNIEFWRHSWEWQQFCEGVTCHWQWKRHPEAQLFAISFIDAWHFAQCEICDGVWSNAAHGIVGFCDDAEKILCKHRMFIYPKEL